MVTRFLGTLAVLAGCCITQADAQVMQRVQPIVLEASSTCCASPASTASQLVSLPCGDCTYLPPKDRDPLRVVPTSSQLKPLPTGPQWRGYAAAIPTRLTGYAKPLPPSVPVVQTLTGEPESVPTRLLPTTTLTDAGEPAVAGGPMTPSITRYPVTVTPLPATTTAVPATVRVLRPPTPCIPTVPSVPDGYVVGKGLIGQPKLYKPGQPVRNFLRYITL